MKEEKQEEQEEQEEKPEKGHEEVKVQYVTSSRPWKNILPREVKLAGAYRKRPVARGGEPVDVPHSFTVIARSGHALLFEDRVKGWGRVGV